MDDQRVLEAIINNEKYRIVRKNHTTNLDTPHHVIDTQQKVMYLINTNFDIKMEEHMIYTAQYAYKNDYL